MTLQKTDLRPQPLSIFPLPAGYLILPAVPGAEAVRDSLLQGKYPTQWPEALRFYQYALAGENDKAIATLQADESLVAQYNRFVLDSNPARYMALRAQLEAAESELLRLLDVVAYTLGYLEQVSEPGALDNELRAFVLMTQATHFVETGDLMQAAALLREAHAAADEVSPLFATQLLGSLAELEHQAIGANPLLIQRYRQAIDALAGTDLALTRAELLLNLGICYQEIAAGQRGALMEAIHCYQDALQCFTPVDHAELYALAHNNLALAYLAMPMTEASDQLRMGIAVQSLRAALRIYTKESYPELWASTQLNLANALQYLPSSHPEDNLAEAVDLYEQILETRTVQENPLGYARLLANQGNALAHLGIHDHASTKLQEAQALFLAHDEVDAAKSIDTVLAEIEGHHTTSDTPLTMIAESGANGSV